jgi:hypothetical protein
MLTSSLKLKIKRKSVLKNAKILRELDIGSSSTLAITPNANTLPVNNEKQKKRKSFL